MKDVAKYWLEIAEYDLETAKGLITLERYIYAIFMCHQATKEIANEIMIKTEGLFLWLKQWIR